MCYFCSCNLKLLLKSLNPHNHQVIKAPLYKWVNHNECPEWHRHRTRTLQRDLSLSSPYSGITRHTSCRYMERRDYAWYHTVSQHPGLSNTYPHSTHFRIHALQLNWYSRAHLWMPLQETSVSWLKEFFYVFLLNPFSFQLIYTFLSSL